MAFLGVNETHEVFKLVYFRDSIFKLGILSTRVYISFLRKGVSAQNSLGVPDVDDLRSQFYILNKTDTDLTNNWN